MEGGDGGWRGGAIIFIYFFLEGGGGARNIIILCIPIHSYVFGKKDEAQFIRMSSNSFVCSPPKEA